jgi:hypothetical protein
MLDVYELSEITRHQNTILSRYSTLCNQDTRSLYIFRVLRGEHWYGVGGGRNCLKGRVQKGNDRVYIPVPCQILY